MRNIAWRRKWQPTPVFLPGESHGQRSLAGYSPPRCKESDSTNTFTLILSCSCSLACTFNYSSFLSHVCCASLCTVPPPVSPQKKTNFTLISWFLSLCSQHQPLPCSVQFSCSVVSNSFRSHELQHARPPCPSPTPGVHPNSRPSSQ